MRKLTPQQAWEHVKALWPNAPRILKYKSDQFIIDSSSREVNIDWPPGVDRWPPPEPKYREPTMADVGKMVEVRYNERQHWIPRKLIYVLREGFRLRFTTVSQNEDVIICFEMARIKDEGGEQWTA